MTDTPRTDAVFWKFHSHDDMVNLARDLERELNEARQWLDKRYKHLSEADERAEKAEANLRRAIEIAEALSSELYFPDFVAEIAAMKTSLSSLSSPSSL